MKYKMIALDLDGTLNNDQKVISPVTKNSLIEVQKQGVRVVLASGRPAPGLKRECDSLELVKYHGLLLSYNGGKVIDAATNEVLYEQSIPNHMAVKLLSHLEQFPVNVMVDDGIDMYAIAEDGFQVSYEYRNNNMGLKIVNNLAASIDFSPVKILIAAPPEVLAVYEKEIAADFQDKFSFVRSAPVYLEATLKGISKAESLGRAAAVLNIKQEEIMAFGDGLNDLSMIQFAGLGVAMGNACEELKEAADVVTLSNNEDGIALILKKYCI